MHRGFMTQALLPRRALDSHEPLHPFVHSAPKRCVTPSARFLFVQVLDLTAVSAAHLLPATRREGKNFPLG